MRRHPKEVWDYQQIAKAVGFNAHLRLSPFEKYNVPADNLAQARAAAGSLNTISKYGRRAVVYAITKEGLSIAVPEDYGRL